MCVVCVCVCVCACVWTSVCGNLSVYVDISLYTCKCVCVCTHTSVCQWTSVCMYVHVCLSVCEHQSVYQWRQNGVGWGGWRVFNLVRTKLFSFEAIANISKIDHDRKKIEQLLFTTCVHVPKDTTEAIDLVEVANDFIACNDECRACFGTFKC